MFSTEIRSGQNETAIFYPVITTLDGEEKRYSALGSSFWCKETQASQTTKEFRDGIEGKAFSCIIASTNVSKIREVSIDSQLYSIEDGGQVEYDHSLRTISYAQYNKLRKVYFIALK